MSLRQQPIFHILLLLFCLILVGYYLDLNVILRRLEPAEDQGLYVIYNPLNDIFTRKHEFGSQRLFMFRSLVFFLLLPAVTIRYFATGRRHKGLLHASLAIYFWAGLGSLLNMATCYLWKTWTPPYVPDMNFDLDLRLAALPFLQVALSFMLLRNVRTEDPGLTSSPMAQPVPVKWMRVFHSPVDAIVMLFMASNGFFTYYIFYLYKPIDSYSTPVHLIGLAGWASFTLSLWISYIVMEKVFQITPAKALTGMMVAHEGDGGHPSFGNIIGRTFARLIPFERYSFFFGRGWHDSLSHTQLVYTEPGRALFHHNRLITGAAVLLSVNSVWLVIVVLTQLGTRQELFEGVASVPAILQLCGLYLMILLFSGWMATITNYAENLARRETKERPMHFLLALLCWVPLLHFKMPAIVLDQATENLEATGDNPEAIEKLHSHTTVLCRTFAVFYTLIFVGMTAALYTGSRNGLMMGALLSGIGCIIGCIGMVIYARGLSAFLQSTSERAVPH